MKAGWRNSTIGEECVLINGGTPKSGVGAYWGGPIQWITPAEMGKRESPYIAETKRTITEKGVCNSSAAPLPPYSVILSSRAPIGHLVINTAPMATNQGCKGLIPKKSITYKYLYYYLKSMVAVLDQMGTGATFRELSGTKLKEVPLSIAPIAEQERIVAILDEAFEAIANAQSLAERNASASIQLFEAKLDSATSTTGPPVTLQEVCSIPSKLIDPRDSDFIDLPHIGAGNIESNSGTLLDIKTAREEKLISGKFLFDCEVVLYSKIRPYLRKVARPDFTGLCSADMYPLLPGKRLDRGYLYYLLLSSKFTRYAIEGSARSGMPKVNREHLFKFNFTLPALSKQRQIATRLDELVTETQRLGTIRRAKNAALNALRDSLLHQAFSGNL